MYGGIERQNDDDDGRDLNENTSNHTKTRGAAVPPNRLTGPSAGVHRRRPLGHDSAEEAAQLVPGCATSAATARRDQNRLKVPTVPNIVHKSAVVVDVTSTVYHRSQR